MKRTNYFVVKWAGFLYKRNKFLFNLKAKLILWLINDIPVIVNCTIYDDVFEYNFGSTYSWFKCIAFNNNIKPFTKYARKLVREEDRLSSKGLKRYVNGVIVLDNLNT